MRDGVICGTLVGTATSDDCVFAALVINEGEGELPGVGKGKLGRG